MASLMSQILHSVPGPMLYIALALVAILVLLALGYEAYGAIVNTAESEVWGAGAPLTTLSIAMMVVCLSFTIMRLHAARTLVVNLPVLSTLIACILTLALGALNLLATRSSYGISSVRLSEAQLQAVMFQYWNTQIMYTLAMTFNSLAFLDIGQSVFGHLGYFRLGTNILKAFIFACGHIAAVITAVQCIPIQGFWTGGDLSQCWLAPKAVGVINGAGPVAMFLPWMGLLVRALWFREANLIAHLHRWLIFGGFVAASSM